MKKILFGMTCYGSYVDTFIDFCLPSLMAAGNLPALAKEYEVLFQVHTTPSGADKLKGKIPYYIGFELDINADDKYKQLGQHQYKDLQVAKRMGMDYHLLHPDFVYSDNCFAGVLTAIERGHKAIARLVVSTVAEDISLELNRPRSAIDLATLAFEHRHPGIRSWFVTPKGYPNTHVLAFVGKDTLRMQSPHCSPVYIAHEAIAPLNSELPLDCILDLVIKGDIYFPKPNDSIVMIEMSPREARKPQMDCVDLAEFCRIFKWDTRNEMRQFEIFKQETIDAIHPQVNYWEEQEIARIQESVYSAILNNRGG
jgi:hypothetical protein